MNKKLNSLFVNNKQDNTRNNYLIELLSDNKLYIIKNEYVYINPDLFDDDKNNAISIIILSNSSNHNENSKLEMIKYLIENFNHNILSYNKYNNSPLHNACYKSYHDIIRYFLKNESNNILINKKNNYNQTILHILYNSQYIFKFENFNNFDTPNVNKKNNKDIIYNIIDPYITYKDNNSFEIIEDLDTKYLDIGYYSNHEIVDELLDNKYCNFFSYDKFNKTPLDYIIDNNNFLALEKIYKKKKDYINKLDNYIKKKEKFENIKINTFNKIIFLPNNLYDILRDIIENKIGYNINYIYNLIYYLNNKLLDNDQIILKINNDDTISNKINDLQNDDNDLTIKKLICFINDLFINILKVILISKINIIILYDNKYYNVNNKNENENENEKTIKINNNDTKINIINSINHININIINNINNEINNNDYNFNDVNKMLIIDIDNDYLVNSDKLNNYYQLIHSKNIEKFKNYK